MLSKHELTRQNTQGLSVELASCRAKLFYSIQFQAKDFMKKCLYESVTEVSTKLLTAPLDLSVITHN